MEIRQALPSGAGRASAHGRPTAPRTATDVVRALAGAAFLIGATLLLIGAASMPLRAGAANASRTVTTVLVREGETLTEIAARVDGGAPTRETLQAIRELNGLSSSDLLAGAVIRVPADSSTDTALASR